jgi:hypothetical protein
MSRFHWILAAKWLDDLIPFHAKRLRRKQARQSPGKQPHQCEKFTTVPQIRNMAKVIFKHMQKQQDGRN